MLRRDFVRAVITVSLAPRGMLSQQSSTAVPAPVPWTLGLNSKTPLPLTETVDMVAETEASFFTKAQMGTFERLCDVLLPPIGNWPGALQSGTPAFLDFLIGSSPEARQRVYTVGLDWLDSASKDQFQLPFAGLSDVQAGALLKPWLRTWMTDHPPSERHADFVNIAHEDILTATMNSEAWSAANLGANQDLITEGLYWFPIEPDVDRVRAACARTPARIIGAPKAAHTFPSYPR
jgi:hypothetical protein